MARTGRPKGAVSRRSLQAFRAMREHGCDPLANLCRMANGDFAALGWPQGWMTAELQYLANKALMPYRWPVLKAQEIEHINPPPPMQINIVQYTKPPVADGSDAKVINITPAPVSSNIVPMPFKPPKRYEES